MGVARPILPAAAAAMVARWARSSVEPSSVTLLLGGGLYFKNKKSTMVSINCCSSIGGNVEHRTNQSSKVVEAEDKGRSESNSQPTVRWQPVQPVAMQPAYVVQQPQYDYSADLPRHGQPQVVQMAPVAPAYPSMN